MPDFEIEKSLGCKHIAGVDEAGRGPLAGPVVAAAVVFRDMNSSNPIFSQINDSKKLSAKKREELYDVIFDSAWVGVGLSEPHEIDKINILQATFVAMNRAIVNLEITPGMALVDGNLIPKGCSIPAKAVIKGDAKSISIAAASIVAKVFRDRIMQKLDVQYPNYGWKNNAGYGVKLHLDAIEKHGACEHHRKSFAPIKQLSLF